MRSPTLAFTLSVMALAAAIAPGESPSELEAALAESEAAMRAALRSADEAALVEHYTDDAEMLGTSGQVIRGRAAIRRHMAEVIALGVRDFSVEDQELFEGPDHAVETGRAVFTNGAGTRLAVVRYMTLWKRTIDGWRIHRDLAAPVSLGPAAEPEAPVAFRVRQSAPFHALVLPVTGPYEQTGVALGRLVVGLAEHEIEPLGPAFGRYYDDEDEVPPTELRFEVGFPVAAGTAASPPFEVRRIDDGLVAWAVVGGPHQGPARPWPALEEWVAASGYAEAGPAIEAWLDGPKTEMRMPVRRID